MKLLAIISSSVGLIGQISHLMIVQNVSDHCWAMGRSCIINKPWIIRIINAKKSQKKSFLVLIFTFDLLLYFVFRSHL